MRNCLIARRAVFTIAIAVFLIAGCGQSAAPSSIKGAAGASPSPGEVRPKRQSLDRVVEQPGTVQAYEETQLFARVPGYVRLPYDSQGRIVTDIGRRVHGPKLVDGKVVEPGDIVAELEVPDLVQQVKEKQAFVEQMRADVEQAEKALAAAEAGITVAKATLIDASAAREFWEMQSKKFAAMVKNGVLDSISRDEADKQLRSASGRLTAAEAAVVKAKADRDKAEADVKSVRSRVGVAQAQAQYVAEMLGFATIRAPFDGIITRRKANTGDLVQAGGKGDWLFTVARLDPVRVVVQVPEADAELVKEGAAVKLTVHALNGAVLSGKVARSSWDLEPGSRTLRTEIDLPNKEGTLRPGMYLYARIAGNLPETWALPASAVVKQGDALVCFRIVDGKAVRTPVQARNGNGQFIEVLKWQKSLSPPVWEDFTGDESIAARAAGLSDGQAVQLGDSGR